ncbi:MAG: hypothetical protein WCJ75_13120 [Desulfomonile sp.]|jgi:hypothetical protein
MESLQAPESKNLIERRQGVPDDPRYDEIKRIIENFPREKMENLKSYIQRWLGRP